MSEEVEKVNQAENELGHVSRILNVFISPGKTFNDINKKAVILVPVLILFVIYGVVMVAQYDLLQQLSRMQLEAVQLNNPDVQFTEEMIAQSARFGLIVGVLGAVFTPLIKGLVTHGLSMMADGEGTMKKTVSVMVYSYFIVLLGRIIAGIIAIISNNPIVSFSPAVFLDSAAFGTPMYNILSFFDVFAIWYLIVSIIGVKIIQKISYKKSAIVVLLPTLVLFLMTVVPAIMNLY